jgi:hypothetical protein
MSIQLFRKGTTHNIKGVECEMGTFKVRQLQSMLDEGWVNCPNKLLEVDLTEALEPVDDLPEPEPEPEAPSQEEADTNNSGKLSAKEVRAAAKAAGIEDWANKRIATLKAALGYDD